MFRFLSTLALTVVAIVAATAWWSADSESRPAVLDVVEEEASNGANATPEVVPGVDGMEVPPAPRPAVAKPAPEIAAPTPQSIDRDPAPAAPERELPAIPAPRLGERRIRTLPPIVLPPPEAEPQPEETEIADSFFFEEWPEPSETAEEDVPAEPATPFAVEEEQPRAIAMRTEHDRSAKLIRRLLDVYQDLGKRR